MQRTINNPVYPDIDSSLNHWAQYMYAFGMGHKLGVDLPGEKRGLVPTANTYNKIYGKGKWNYCTFRSVSIGQGEVLSTPLQVANEMAYLANKGWFITPHLVDSIEGGDVYAKLEPYKNKHIALSIADSLFEAVHDGMQGVMESGTGRFAKVPGISVCGKTGTVENYDRGIKQKDHAFFAAFAPRENPRIAIAVICENAGFGAGSAAPIASLMIEQYLNDSIAGAARKKKVEEISKMNLIPARMLREIRRQDSLLHARDTGYLIAKGYLKMIRDTADIDVEIDNDEVDIIKNEKPQKNKSARDTARAPEALLPGENRRAAADSSRINR